jgi:DMSO/TMAO reductase YedYZ molybdopterin-dependent catalytic subunit
MQRGRDHGCFVLVFAGLKRFLPFFAVLFAGFLGHAEDTALAVTGEVKSPLKLTLGELKSMHSVKVTVKDSDGATVSFEGVPLHAILQRAGAPQGESLKGPALQLCVSVKATDDYKVVFSLAELDPLFTDKQVLLAYMRDGKDLDSRTGPLRLVVPEEKRHGRWVRQVRELEVERVVSADTHQRTADALGKGKDVSTH